MTFLSAVAATWSRAARAQPTAMPVVGWINSGSRDSLERPLGAFRQSLAESGCRQAGIYVAKILRGAKPATKFDLTINLNAANALGLSVSNQMQLLADEVIE